MTEYWDYYNRLPREEKMRRAFAGASLWGLKQICRLRGFAFVEGYNIWLQTDAGTKPFRKN